MWEEGKPLTFYRPPPTTADLEASITSIYGLPRVINVKPFFSRREDLKDSLRHMHHIDDLADFDTCPTIKMALDQHKDGPPGGWRTSAVHRREDDACQVCLSQAKPPPPLYGSHRPYVILQPTRDPPYPDEVKKWLETHGLMTNMPTDSLDGSDDEGEGMVRFANNAMGVLGAGGGLEREDKEMPLTPSQASEKQEDFVMDPNTGQLIPQHHTAPKRDAPSWTAGTISKGTLNKPYRSKLTSQISPPTPTPNSHTPSSADRGFRMNPFGVKNDTIIRSSEGNRLTVLSLEIHVNTRLDLRPDPRFDPVAAVCYSVHDYRNWSSEHERVDEYTGVILSATATQKPADVPLEPRSLKQDDHKGGPTTSGSSYCPLCKTKDRDRFCACGKRQGAKPHVEQHSGPGVKPLAVGVDTRTNGHVEDDPYEGLALGPNVSVDVATDEIALFHQTLELIRSFDPEFLVGWEVQKSSLGYLIERADHLETPTPIPMAKVMGRIKERPGGVTDTTEDRTNDEWGESQASGIWIVGRHVLNLWRLMRSELKLSLYTLQNVTAHVLGRRLPSFSHRVMTQWFTGNRHTRALALGDTLTRTRLNLQLLDKLDLIGRTAEMARIFGIDFFSVLNRGSQYRVEAVMMRVVKPLNFVVISPSRKQVAGQRALEVQPLVHEPQSGFYSEPVAILDFQSLYPSMIIAYNLCFSTYTGCFTPEVHRGLANTYGTAGCIPWPKSQTARALYAIGQPDATGCFVSPNGAIFCPRSTRQGVLPRMLYEILETRFMIKRAMKRPEYQRNAVLQRVLNARQFGLKMIANVTYGYTSASFSGRMPMAELADAIVSTARNTVEKGRHLIEGTASIQPARVVYGDTDSLFVELRGLSCSDAVVAGKKIAQMVSDTNPPGVVLKFEKVFFPSMLVAKKRYVGHAYEEAGGKAHFDAKGLEVVRRDTCALTVKMQEKVLRILFTSRDVSQVSRDEDMSQEFTWSLRYSSYIIPPRLLMFRPPPPPSPC